MSFWLLYTKLTVTHTTCTSNKNKCVPSETVFKFGKREQQISWVELLESLSVQIVERGLLAVVAVYCTLHCVLHGITLGSFPNRSHSHDPHPCPHPRNVEYDSSPFLCVHRCGIDPDCVTSEGPSRSDTFPARRGLSPDFPCMSSLQSLWV